MYQVLFFWWRINQLFQLNIVVIPYGSVGTVVVVVVVVGAGVGGVL